MGNRDVPLHSDGDAYTQIKIPRGPRSRTIQLQAPSSKGFAPGSTPGSNAAISTCAGSSASKGPVRLTSHLYDTPLAESPIITAPATFRMASKLELRVAGEQFIFDLSKLEDDPKSIIALLKVAYAERAHWMIVAAFYRRKGNACAAIKLMIELIQALNGQGVDPDKMKPVYLMLSGCEADLAKQAKECSSIHYINSRAWLQKVYGTFDDPPESKTRDGCILTTSGARSPSSDRSLDEVNGRATKRLGCIPTEPRSEKRRRLCMNQQYTTT
ncbi:hypothetical protein AX14_010252 [Amanita brunnescens Koide BX004]|nr:hypothetical protein AX14_010252 [Amanita brunnescens Koide BX004]